MLETPLMEEVKRSGFDAPESVIHLFIGGSELHGAKVGSRLAERVDLGAISELVARVYLVGWAGTDRPLQRTGQLSGRES